MREDEQAGVRKTGKTDERMQTVSKQDKRETDNKTINIEKLNSIWYISI